MIFPKQASASISQWWRHNYKAKHHIANPAWDSSSFCTHHPCFIQIHFNANKVQSSFKTDMLLAQQSLPVSCSERNAYLSLHVASNLFLLKKIKIRFNTLLRIKTIYYLYFKMLKLGKDSLFFFLSFFFLDLRNSQLHYTSAGKNSGAGYTQYVCFKIKPKFGSTSSLFRFLSLG